MNTLRWAVEQANEATSASSIEIELGSSPSTITLGQGQLELTSVTSAITIYDGPGQGPVTISGNNAGRVFQVATNVTASLSGLTITGGGSVRSGGGLYNSGTTTLTDCTISGNSAESGGGLDNQGATTLTDCTISGNSADSGGGLGIQGATTLTDCTISGNSAEDGGGLLTGAGTATLKNCTINENSAESGGGLYDEGTAYLTDCTISGNSAANGGGLGTGEGTAYLTNCTVSGNAASGRAGGLNNNDGRMILTDSTISGNLAEIGGGLYSRYGAANLLGTIVAGNANSAGASDIDNDGGALTGSYNLIGTGGSGGITNSADHNIVLTSLLSLGLAPLGDYGGPTETVALLPGSAAIGAGTTTDYPQTTTAITTDQRGLPLDSPDPDIGAFQKPLVATTTQLASSVDPSTVGQTVVFTATVAPAGGASAPRGAVTFTIDGQAEPPSSLSMVNGVDRASFSIANLGAGTHTIAASYSGGADFVSSSSSTLTQVVGAAVPAPQPVTNSVQDGPKIVSVLRFGYHMKPTTVVLTFDQALDAITAEGVSDYRLIGPGGRAIGINRAVYDPAALTVTLHPSQRINVRYTYKLIVDGTAPHGLTNTLGLLLDGADSGRPDSNFRAPLSWLDLVISPRLLKKYRPSLPRIVG